MAFVSLDAHNRSLSQANGFDIGSLESNRSGRLTPGQAQQVRSHRRSWGNTLLVIGLICIVAGGWNLLPGHGDSEEGGRFGAFMVVIVGIAILALRFTNAGRSYATEIEAGRVSSVEGFVRVRRSSGSDGASDSYFYRIEEREFQTTEAGANAIDAHTRYRIYHLPDSDIMVNIEALGQAFLESPREGAQLDAQEIGAIVGETLRRQADKRGDADDAWPGMVLNVFESTQSELRVVVGFLLGAQDSSILNFYRRLLARAPGARAIAGLGDEATFSGRLLLVRRGDVFILVILMRPGARPDPERVLEIEQRLALLALRTLR
jgi:hypothetical protein